MDSSATTDTSKAKCTYAALVIRAKVDNMTIKTGVVAIAVRGRSSNQHSWIKPILKEKGRKLSECVPSTPRRNQVVQL